MNNDEQILQTSVESLRAATKDWSRADKAYDFFEGIRDGTTSLPVLEFTTRGADGNPQRIEIDLEQLTDDERNALVDVLIIPITAEYKRSLASIANHSAIAWTYLQQDSNATNASE